MTKRELLLNLCEVVGFRPDTELLLKDDNIFVINFRDALWNIQDDRRHDKDGPDRELADLCSFILKNFDNIIKGNLEDFPDIEEKIAALHS